MKTEKRPRKYYVRVNENDGMIPIDDCDIIAVEQYCQNCDGGGCPECAGTGDGDQVFIPPGAVLRALDNLNV